MKATMIPLAFTALMLAGEAVRAETAQVTVCSGEWAPFTSAHLPAYGYSSDVVTQAFARVGVEVQYKFFPWKRSFALAKMGRECDALIGYVWLSKRERDFIYSAPIMTQPYVFFHLVDRPLKFDGDVESIRGAKVGGNAGSNHTRMYRARDAGIIDFEVAGDTASNMQKLLRQRFDALPLPREVGEHYLRNELSPQEALRITYSPVPIGAWDYHLLFSRQLAGAEALKEQFNLGLRGLRSTQDALALQVKLGQGFYDEKVVVEE
ncbi:MAG: substrate-binding periplasmic protein [Pseudomonadales bacterium]